MAYAGLTIRGQRTRWASCSSEGRMSFNWRLLLAPEPVLDYVVEHEVCHLEVMDHSVHFWRLLESRVPDWRAHAAWLRRYGPALERFYRRAARAEIAPRLDAAVARAGTAYSGLTIRGQRTRWASCSSEGRMSFNWRLLLAPEPVLDYVVEHEVCHLEVMDHSPRFWSLLESRAPDWREHAAWLRRYGSALRLPDTVRRSAA
ncbi:MAG TPA: M48 family metallopeptidase, partial [Solirubrobacteraceae bacterium]|nr:M48 family metallopeptidase [Solirubrobacteraceae bacterium]